MRTLITLITALLLFVACSATRKAAEKDTASMDQAASLQQTATAKETTSAAIDQATLEEILQRLYVTCDWERWEFNAGAPPETGAQPSSVPTSRGRDATTGKPPNAGPPASVTKGSLKITSEGSQNRATRTSAGSRTQKADSVDTKATAKKNEQTQREKSENVQAKNTSPVLYLAVLLILSACTLYIVGRRMATRK